MASAPELEIKLFNKGYEYLFSYKPEQAAETFRIFLKEFPESSIRDAAMFWLGKTLISTKHYSEAELTFRTIQKEFPDSPFMDFIDTEMEAIAKSRAGATAKEPTDLSLTQADIVSLKADEKTRIEETERKPPQIPADKEKAPSVPDDRNKVEELKSQQAGVKEQQNRSQVVHEAPSSPQLDPEAVVRIGNRAYRLTQIIEYHVTASAVFKRFGIMDIAWRTGNPLDDFIAEELLFMEAKKAQVTIDAKKLKEMAESQKLGAAEADYLDKVMTIARYIDMQYADDPTEKWIELISVDYKPGDAAAKTVLATDLQKAAREGTSFEEIGRMHPDAVKFSRLSLGDFSTKYREKSQIIQKLNFLNEETVVIWSEKGFMLIKPISVRVHFSPFEELSTQKKERLKAFLRQWFSEHRK